MVERREIIHRINVPIEKGLRFQMKAIAVTRGMSVKGAVSDAISQWIKRWSKKPQ